MKLATRISSIRRNGLEHRTSCSPASDSMCALSLASHRDAGCTRSPRSASTRVTGFLGQPVDLQVGVQGPQLVGDRQVAADMAQPDRRADVQRTAPAVAGAAPGTLALRLRRQIGSAKSRISRFVRTVRASSGHGRRRGSSPAPRRSSRASATPVSYGTMPSLSPWTTRTGQRTARQIASASASVRRVDRRRRSAAGSRRRSPGPSRRRPPDA